MVEEQTRTSVQVSEDYRWGSYARIDEVTKLCRPCDDDWQYEKRPGEPEWAR